MGDWRPPEIVALGDAMAQFLHDTKVPRVASRMRRLRRPLAKLPARLLRRALREAAPLLPVRGRLPGSWVAKMAPAIGARTWRDHFALDRGRGWYWSLREQDEVRTWIKRRSPRMIASVTQRADSVCAGALPILGHGPIAWSPQMGWTRDPVTGVDFPQVRAERFPIILPDRKSDIKHVWEPARFHYAPTLAAAFHLTGEVRYAETLRDYIADFIRENPCGYGPQWTTPMEMAIRVCNWIVAWQWCREAPIFDEAFVRTFIGSIIEHARVIARHLERTRRGLNTNHYIADLVGLYAVATFIPEWKESRRWRRLAWKELLAESEHQILPDGFCYESSFAYHRLTFEMWYFAWTLGSRHEESDSKDLADVLRRMSEFSRASANALGRLPQFGDGDDGRFVFWESREPDDHSHTIQLATALPGYSEPHHGHGIIGDPVEDLLWLAGTDAYRECWRHAGEALRLDRTTSHESRVFPDSQVAVLRSDRWLVHVFANPVGSGGIGGHKHNDMLSFTASLDGVPVIIDPGTGAYTADPPARNRFRRTSVHSTVTIDGCEQNRFIAGQLFCLWPDATPAIVEFNDTGESVRVVMRHDGYARLAHPVIHERTLTLDRTTESLCIHDRIEGTGSHAIAMVLPLSDIRIRSASDHSACLVLPEGEALNLELASANDFRMSVSLGWRSRAYGVREGHRRLVFHANITVPAEWETRLRIVPPEESDLSGSMPTRNAASRAVDSGIVPEIHALPEVSHA